MTVHTSRAVGTAYQQGVGLVNVEPLRSGSPLMRLIPIDYHPHYSDNPLIRHRNLIEWRHNPKEKP